MSSDKTVAKVEGQTIKAPTSAGAAYVKKATHPPSILPMEYQGVPDGSQANVVLMEVKGETNFAPILLRGDGAKTMITTNPSKMLFLTLPGAKVSVYCFMPTITGGVPGWVQPVTGQASGSVLAKAQTTPPALTTSGYQWANFQQDVGRHRVTYKSNTFYLNATDFNNQGTVTTAKFKPNFATVGLSTLKTHTHLAESHPFGKVEGLKLIELALKAGVSGPFAAQFLDMGICPSGGIVYQSTDSDPAIEYVLPATPSDVLTLSPKAVTQPAKEGSFVVYQPVESVQPWATTTIAQEGQGVNGPLLSFIRFRESPSSEGQYMPLISELGGSSSSLASETPWNNLDASWVMFDGLTVPNQVTTVLSGVPYITVKGYAGMEIDPQTNGSLRPFSRLLPMPDRVALDMAFGIFYERPDGLPASANDLASIASTIMGFLPKAGAWLKDMFGGGSKTAAPPQAVGHDQRVRLLEEALAQANQTIRRLEQALDRFTRMQMDGPIHERRGEVVVAPKPKPRTMAPLAAQRQPVVVPQPTQLNGPYAGRAASGSAPRSSRRGRKAQ